MSWVGKNIEAFCTRCKLTLMHVVLYEVGGAVHGVQCRTCGAEHRYRGTQPGRRPPRSPVRRPGVRSAQPKIKSPGADPADAKRWEARNNAVLPEAVIWDYHWTQKYEKDDVIVHPLFGRGFVESITTDGMEVLFREGRKQMAMNRLAADAS